MNFGIIPDDNSPAILAITIASPPGGIGERFLATSRAYTSQTDLTAAHQFLISSGDAPPGCLSALTNSVRNRCSNSIRPWRFGSASRTVSFGAEIIRVRERLPRKKNASAVLGLIVFCLRTIDLFYQLIDRFELTLFEKFRRDHAAPYSACKLPFACSSEQVILPSAPELPVPNHLALMGQLVLASSLSAKRLIWLLDEIQAHCHGTYEPCRRSTIETKLSCWAPEIIRFSSAAQASSACRFSAAKLCRM